MSYSGPSLISSKYYSSNVVGRRYYSSSSLLAVKSSDPQQASNPNSHHTSERLSNYWVFITAAVGATALVNVEDLRRSHGGKTVPREYEERGFEDYLKATHQSETVLPATHPTREKVARIAQNVFDALRRGVEDSKVWGGTVYALGVTKKSLSIHWQVFVVDDPNIDRVDCFKDGKIVVYTGLLDHPSKSDAEIAYIIAQQVALAVARPDIEDCSMIWGASLLTSCILPGRVTPRRNILLTFPFILITGQLSGLVKRTSDFFALLLTASAGYHPQDVVDLTPFSVKVEERVMAVYQNGLSSLGN